MDGGDTHVSFPVREGEHVVGGERKLKQYSSLVSIMLAENTEAKQIQFDKVGTIYFTVNG